MPGPDQDQSRVWPSEFGRLNGDAPAPDRGYRWYHKVAGVMAAIFCFELGVFLLVFPWIDLWDAKYFGYLPMWARDIWVNAYFKGAVSGLGLLNIYISFTEVFRLKRFST